MSSSKIIPFQEGRALFEKIRTEGRRIVQCHGTFDLVHPGHIYHLEEARSLGDLLVVTVTGERHVNKGPGRPYFNDQLRAKSLAALECVDYVVLVPHPAAVEAIDCVRPHIYCKGSEYEDANNDVTGNIRDDVAAVERHGGKISYVGSVVFSSTKLLNNHLDILPTPVKDFCRKLSESCTPNQFREAVDAFSDLRVLLVGDVIFDRYSYVRVQGLTSKASIVSCRHLYEETQTGGSLAVYRHLRQFTPHVRLVGLVGEEKWVDAEIGQHIDAQGDLLVRDPEFTTIIKHRFVTPPSEGKELQRLFSVNYIDNGAPGPEAIDKVLRAVRENIEWADVVMVTDFGHGLMQQAVRDLVQDRAKFFSLNCQTNSNNHGFNVINRQYRRADAFSLDATEMLLAVGRREIEHRTELEALQGALSSRYAWLTRGDIETIGLRHSEEACSLLPLEKDIVDTIGAGDAFFSTASLAAAKGYSNALTTFIGQIAGAQAVKIVGNTKPITKAGLLKAGMTLLNF